jgi:hypothetical protein
MRRRKDPPLRGGITRSVMTTIKDPLAPLVLALALFGWGECDVSGKVRFQGSPRTGGWVTFTYPDGTPAPARHDPNRRNP